MNCGNRVDWNLIIYFVNRKLHTKQLSRGLTGNRKWKSKNVYFLPFSLSSMASRASTFPPHTQRIAPKSRNRYQFHWLNYFHIFYFCFITTVDKTGESWRAIEMKWKKRARKKTWTLIVVRSVGLHCTGTQKWKWRRFSQFFFPLQVLYCELCYVLCVVCGKNDIRHVSSERENVCVSWVFLFHLSIPFFISTLLFRT